jgi:hypothetical protein
LISNTKQFRKDDIGVILEEYKNVLNRWNKFASESQDIVVSDFRRMEMHIQRIYFGSTMLGG